MQSNLVFKYFSFLLLLVFLTGCGGSAPTVVKKKEPLPEWVNGILPNDTAQEMYGFGVAKNRNLAIKTALNDTISRLGISIESQYESYEKVQYHTSSQKITNNIKADIAKVKINNYKVVKSYKISYNAYAVIVAVDKMKFLDGLKEQLEVDKKSISDELKSIKNRNKIVQYNTKYTLAQKANSLKSAVFMIAQLDRSFPKAKNLKFIEDVQKAYLQAKHSLKFYLHGDSRSKDFVVKLKNYLSSQNFNVTSQKNNAVFIKITTDTTITTGSVKIAILKLNIKVYDKYGDIGGKSKIIKERYKTPLSLVYKNAAIHFEQDIKELGLENVIGIHLQRDTND